MISQRDKVLKTIQPGDWVYACIPGYAQKLYQVGGIIGFRTVLLGDSIVLVTSAEMLPPF
jgi:hypothetical protein